MNIELRPIRYDDNKDKENYFALQKSVAILSSTYHDNEKYNEQLWKAVAKDNNRICFVIETLPEHSYCGQCAVKNISDDIPEIEIELMKGQQNKGIGYYSLVIMLNRLAEEYKKEKFYAKVEPDNYISQLLFEKLGGVPAGISRDYQISDERMEKFTKTHEYLLDEKIHEIADAFGVEAELLLAHVLIYLIDVGNMNLLNNRSKETSGSRKKIECPRNITKEKYADTMKEMLENLQELMGLAEKDEKSALIKKLNEVESKLLNRIEKIDSANYFQKISKNEIVIH